MNKHGKRERDKNPGSHYLGGSEPLVGNKNSEGRTFNDRHVMICDNAIQIPLVNE